MRLLAPCPRDCARIDTHLNSLCVAPLRLYLGPKCLPSALTLTGSPLQAPLLQRRLPAVTALFRMARTASRLPSATATTSARSLPRPSAVTALSRTAKTASRRTSAPAARTVRLWVRRAPLHPDERSVRGTRMQSSTGTSDRFLRAVSHGGAFVLLAPLPHPTRGLWVFACARAKPAMLCCRLVPQLRNTSRIKG